jgi:adenylosuccinate lyase
MHRRVQVEVEWFIALSDAGFAEFAPLSRRARALLRALVAASPRPTPQAIKDIERTTNHDVKAVEYWIKPALQAGHAELERAGEFVHFACTSEDINNTSHALMLKAAREPGAAAGARRRASSGSRAWRGAGRLPMLSRTHGQTASPTTVGKEVANVARGCQRRARASPACRCWPR